MACVGVMAPAAPWGAQPAAEQAATTIAANEAEHRSIRPKSTPPLTEKEAVLTTDPSTRRGMRSVLRATAAGVTDPRVLLRDTGAHLCHSDEGALSAPCTVALHAAAVNLNQLQTLPTAGSWPPALHPDARQRFEGQWRGSGGSICLDFAVGKGKGAVASCEAA
jgi:hypothetical protein